MTHLGVIFSGDAIAVLAALAKYAIDGLMPAQEFEEGTYSDIIHSLQLFRVLRLVGAMSKV